MQTITIDGVEYNLVPKESAPIADVPQTTQDAPKSVLNDFLGEDVTSTPATPVDDGLATQDEKKNLITVHEDNQTVISPIVTAPKAQPKKYEYRERYLKKELSSSDVTTVARISRESLKNNPEDPMIKADQNRPKESQLFYGPGIEQE